MRSERSRQTKAEMVRTSSFFTRIKTWLASVVTSERNTSLAGLLTTREGGRKRDIVTQNSTVQ